MSDDITDLFAELMAAKAKWQDSILRTIDPRDLTHVVLEQSPNGVERIMLRGLCLGESSMENVGLGFRFIGNAFDPPR